MTDSSKYSDEIPYTQLVECILARYPDAEQLIAIISRSYDYIQKLPLKGIRENYARENPDLFALVL